MRASPSSATLSQQPRNGLFVREQLAPDAVGVLLFLHGLGESGLCFESLLGEPRLGAWRRIAIDLPGYGKSPWRPEPCDFAATTLGLRAWLEAAELPPVVVVGHSMGGVLGADLAGLAPALAIGRTWISMICSSMPWSISSPPSLSNPRSPMEELPWVSRRG